MNKKVQKRLYILYPYGKKLTLSTTRNLIVKRFIYYLVILSNEVIMNSISSQSFQLSYCDTYTLAEKIFQQMLKITSYSPDLPNFFIINDKTIMLVQW